MSRQRETHQSRQSSTRNPNKGYRRCRSPTLPAVFKTLPIPVLQALQVRACWYELPLSSSSHRIKNTRTKKQNEKKTRRRDSIEKNKEKRRKEKHRPEITATQLATKPKGVLDREKDGRIRRTRRHVDIRLAVRQRHTLQQPPLHARYITNERTNKQKH